MAWDLAALPSEPCVQLWESPLSLSLGQPLSPTPSPFLLFPSLEWSAFCVPSDPFISHWKQNQNMCSVGFVYLWQIFLDHISLAKMGIRNPDCFSCRTYSRRGKAALPSSCSSCSTLPLPLAQGTEEQDACGFQLWSLRQLHGGRQVARSGVCLSFLSLVLLGSRPNDKYINETSATC